MTTRTSQPAGGVLLIAEMKEFVQSVQGNTTPTVTGIDGRIPVVIGMAAKKSYREHRPVKVSEITNPMPELA